LTNSATGCVGPEACESGEAGDRDGEVQPLVVEKAVLGRSLAWRSSAYTRMAARRSCQYNDSQLLQVTTSKCNFTD
jgi:hypothetical protein